MEISEALFDSAEEVRRFERSVRTREIGKRVEFFARTGSTNDLALAAARAGVGHGCVFAADAQDEGRGRRGRSWECPPGHGLLFSVLIRKEGISGEAMGWLPLMAGLSCAEALRGGATIKWPNDVVIPSDEAPGWRKLGGILCESTLGSDGGAAHAVIGIGINVNQTPEMLPPTAKAPPTSLRIESGKIWERKEVLASILERLEANLERLCGGKREVLELRIVEAMRGWLAERRMTFFTPSADHPGAVAQQGIFAGLDSSGRMLVRQGGGVSAVADAEITGVA